MNRMLPCLSISLCGLALLTTVAEAATLAPVARLSNVKISADQPTGEVLGLRRADTFWPEGDGTYGKFSATGIKEGTGTSISTTCGFNDGILGCKGIGTVAAPIQDNGECEGGPVVSGDALVALVEDAELSTLTFPGEVEVNDVKWNWWTMECELEPDDHAECDNDCTDAGAYGGWAQAEQAEWSCILLCTCYDDQGNVLGYLVSDDN